MTGIGILLFFIGYAILVWGEESFQARLAGTSPPGSFIQSIFPFGQ